jgi:hypothetical protein
MRITHARRGGVTFMDLEMKAYKYDNATGDWSQLCSSMSCSFCNENNEGSAMLQVAPSNAAQREAEPTQTAVDVATALHAEAILQSAESAASAGGDSEGEGEGEGENANEDEDEDDDDGNDGNDGNGDADSEDAAAVSRRIVRQSEELLRLLQGASSTQLSEPALAALKALTDRGHADKPG